MEATKTGSILEESVQKVFESYGFTIIKYREWEKAPLLHGEELVLLNAPYETIYGHNGNMEFLVRSKKFNLNLRIECKWQQSSGSVDEKFPYLYLNCIETIKENDIFIILGGKGQKQGAINWLKHAKENSLYTTEKNRDKSIKVLDLEDFIVWANKTLRI